MCGLLFSIFFAVCSDSALPHSNVHDYNKAESEAKCLAKEVLDAVGHSLQLRHPPFQLWARVTWMMKILLRWFYLLIVRLSRLVQAWKFFWHVYMRQEVWFGCEPRSWTQQAQSILKFFWSNTTSGYRHGRPETVARPLGSAELHLHQRFAKMFDRRFSWQRRFFRFVPVVD